jgi:hypothetical protein
MSATNHLTKRLASIVIASLTIVAATSFAQLAEAQNQYIGYVYPAGAQRGTTRPIRLGGQRLRYASDIQVSGRGVTARLVDYYRVMNNQELSLLRQQLKALKKKETTIGDAMATKMAWFEFPGRIGPTKNLELVSITADAPSLHEIAKKNLIDRIERLFAEDERNPAVRAHTELVFAEVTVADDAAPGRREIRVITKSGISNALPFYIGQVPEVARKPMKTCQKPVLGKEHLAQRSRPPEEEEMTVSLPCTMNGQIAAGEVNRYRFQAAKGQRLIISVKARELVPYVADGVPGWFQAVLKLSDAKGNELAFNDDFRFHPDPLICYEVPEDGEYILSINDALFRGRESFVYRITIGELPLITNIFPLGGRAGESIAIEAGGWNLQQSTLTSPPPNAKPGRHLISASNEKTVSNRVPFILDTLPECLDQEPNNHDAEAQQVSLPIIINGRSDQPNDWDVFEVTGKADDMLVVEVMARRLGSPYDSFVKVTNTQGQVIALNDDHYDAASGLNTDHADSYLMLKLPADGKCFVHLGDTRQKSGPAYAYRMRISKPRPDFALRVIPSRICIRGKASAAVTVFALRKDGFRGPIKLNFPDLPQGLSCPGATIAANKDQTRLVLKTTLAAMDEPVELSVVGTATIWKQQRIHKAVPAEDRMQAFLWRHLLPADTLPALVFNPGYQPPAERIRPPIRDEDRPKEATRNLRQNQVDWFLKQINGLYQEWLLTDEFANRQIADVEARLIK